MTTRDEKMDIAVMGADDLDSFRPLAAVITW